MTFTPQDPDFAARIAASFARQGALALIGAELQEVQPGEVTIALPIRPDLCQHHGYVHAGIVTTIVDTACGYAAMSLLPAGSTIVSIEFKLNLLAPATGTALVARGQVKRAGRTIIVCTGDVFAQSNDRDERLVATMLGTMMPLADRPELLG